MIDNCCYELVPSADDLSDGGRAGGIAKPLSFRLINLQAMLNSVKSNFPSAFRSASPLLDNVENNYRKAIRMIRLSIILPYLSQDGGRELRLQQETFGLIPVDEPARGFQRIELLLVTDNLQWENNENIHFCCWWAGNQLINKKNQRQLDRCSSYLLYWCFFFSNQGKLKIILDLKKKSVSQ